MSGLTNHASHDDDRCEWCQQIYLQRTCGKGINPESKVGENKRTQRCHQDATALKHTFAIAASTKDSKGSHGLAPVGIIIPTKGSAFRVGDIGSAKQPMKESKQEKYHQIKAEQEEKTNKKNNRAIKKLKKEDKVGTLASFVYS